MFGVNADHQPYLMVAMPIFKPRCFQFKGHFSRCKKIERGKQSKYKTLAHFYNQWENGAENHNEASQPFGIRIWPVVPLSVFFCSVESPKRHLPHFSYSIVVNFTDFSYPNDRPKMNTDFLK